ncbi:MAG: hypothetical protein ACK583_06225 [Cyanobacteriota bacterium]
MPRVLLRTTHLLIGAMLDNLICSSLPARQPLSIHTGKARDRCHALAEQRAPAPGNPLQPPA